MIFDGTALVHVEAPQKAILQRFAVERGGLHVLDRRGALDSVGPDRLLPMAAGLDDELLIADSERRALERRRVYQEQVLSGDREQTQGRPYVPGAQPAGIVVAR